MVDAFWRRWSRGYLPSLLPRRKWLSPGNPICVGYLVLIIEKDIPRNEWWKAVVVRTYHDSEGQVRKVDLRTEKGIRGSSTSKKIDSFIVSTKHMSFVLGEKCYRMIPKL